jgi:hypothetical protein
VVKLQLGQLGFDSDFLQCQIQVDDTVWDGVRRKYWHGRDTYYLPRITWNQEFLGRFRKAQEQESDGGSGGGGDMQVEQHESKRQRTVDDS